MNSSRLEFYLDSLKYPYVKAYGDKHLNYLGADTNYLSRIFTDSGIVVRNTYSMLFYRFNNIDELNECRRYICEAGFTLDSLRTLKANIEIGDKVESYTLGNIEIQLSDNDFKKEHKNSRYISSNVSIFWTRGAYVFFTDKKQRSVLTKF